MKLKKMLSLALAAAMALSLAACGKKEAPAQSGSQSGGQSASQSGAAQEGADLSDVTIRAAAMNGPTGMGMARLADEARNDRLPFGCRVTFSGSPDDVRAGLLSGELDIAAVPVNMAAALYNKTEGGILTAAVNTLGVLYIVEKGDAVQSMADLAGKKLLAAGQGSTPEYVINYLLEKNDLTGSVEVEYVSEHAEAVTQMAAGNADLILVPEPFVTTALGKVEGARVALDLTREWAKASDTGMVMGCLVVSAAFAQEHPDALEAFMTAYASSADYCTGHPAEAAALIQEFGVMGSAALAEKAIPNCNIVCITGQEMANMVTGMLTVLFDADPKSVGGSLPGEEMFWLG